MGERSHVGPRADTWQSRQYAVKSRRPRSPSTRRIADRSRPGRAPTTHPFSGRRTVFHWLGSEPRAGATRKPWKCCHFVPFCPTKKAWCRNPKTQLALVLAQGIFASAGVRDNTRKKHTPCTVGCTLGKRAQIPERRPSQSPPRCRSGNRPDGRARRLVRPSDCRPRQECRVGADPPDCPAARSKSLIRVFRNQSVKPSTPIMSENPIIPPTSLYLLDAIDRNCRTDALHRLCKVHAQPDPC